MEYYVAAEGGGSKLLSILYDENFRIIRAVRAGAVNDTFKDKAQVCAEMQRLIDDLIPPEITRIEAADISIVGRNTSLQDLLRARFPMADIALRGEGEIALAASFAEEGIIAQAGTGSDAFLIYKDQMFAVGGWGSIIGDQGSGYDIGKRGLEAAVRDNDGWGEPTLMRELLCEQLGYTEGITANFYPLVEYCLDRSNVAALSRVVGAAAARGDKVAIEIVKYAGEMMAEQVLCAIGRSNVALRGTIVASGGAWRTSPIMFDTFCERVRTVYPEAVLMRPLFEPVVGCIVMRFGVSQELKNTLIENFSEFLYQ